jgi:ring-1,2-phenylacetyl-CoA epoxidase subunit PaaC
MTSVLVEAPPIELADRAVANVALGLADDEFVMGHRHSEWLGLSPFLEEDLTLASIAQDELGHARALYGLLWPSWEDRDALLVRRPGAQWRSCALVEQGGLSWEASFVRQLAYDIIEPHRWHALAETWPDPQVAALFERVRAEEHFHRRHVVDLVTRLCRGGDEPLARIQGALNEQWHLFGGLVSDLPATILRPVMSDLSDVIIDAGLAMPDAVIPVAADRATRSAAFDDIHASLVSVVAFDPEATW